MRAPEDERDAGACEVPTVAEAEEHGDEQRMSGSQGMRQGDVDKIVARERLYRAEAAFDELMQGSRDLLVSDRTLYVFADGTEVRGIEAAAREAERLVRSVRANLSNVV